MYQPQGHTRPSCWVRSNNGSIPPNAVVAGNDTSGETLFVGRAWYNQVSNFLPGKIVPSHGVCYVPFGGKEIGISEYEVLTQSPHVIYDWISAENGQIPAGAIIGNRKENGKNDFIGRVFHQGGKIPGKIHVDHKCLYYSYAGKELSSKVYEVLVCRMIDV
ncbi:DgyrCDS23 [Dimorphilus gyrociliatus]|uniref:DgyrCDS23 n=1 Tax=Dimorphilus gyrociliatus TaxID=2664684 RepID=A0A7I8V3D5_9ANNE|nr:DgyrCDS23 [Dimorphilus gyrociliatus]